MSKSIKILFTVLLMAWAVLQAGTTGKIAGVVTDSETGEGLPGVNVVLQGTSLGAGTDADGTFIILNIPRACTILNSITSATRQ